MDGGKGREGGLVPGTGIIAGPRHGYAQNSRKHGSAVREEGIVHVREEGASRVWVRVLVGWMGWRGWRGERSWGFCKGRGGGVCGLEGK